MSALEIQTCRSQLAYHDNLILQRELHETLTE